MPPGHPMQTERRTALYRFFNSDNDLLYIGITIDLRARDYQHAAKSPWWPQVDRKEVCWYDTWTEADAAEGVAIRSEQPRYNIAGNPTPMARPAPPSTRPRLTPEGAQRLRCAADAARQAKTDLLDTMVEAAKDGATNLDIAKEIDFFYNPDYIGKLISKKVGKRRPGRRPKRSTPAENEQSES